MGIIFESLQSLIHVAVSSRYTGLIKSGAVLEENRPLWYDVYKHFPPTVEPLAIREEPKVAICNIYYPEDILRS